MLSRIENPNLMTDILAPYLTDERKQRFEEILAQRTSYFSIALEDIHQPQNASAVLRTAECFGVQNVSIIENYNAYRINPMVVKGSDKWLTIKRFNSPQADNTKSAIDYWREKNYRIVVTTLSESSVAPEDFDISAGKFLLVLGNEHQGASQQMIEKADVHLKIPMFGFTQSLNVSVAAAVLISYFSRTLRQSDIAWQLSKEEIDFLRARYYFSSAREARFILSKHGYPFEQ